MMINEIIVTHLSSNKRLVIPSFGAFLKKENNTITFVELLKKDDEVLTSLISKGMGVSHESALSIVDDYIKSIKEQVRTNGTYVVGTIGSFVIGANGVYNLVSNDSKKVEPPKIVKPTVVAPVSVSSTAQAKSVVPEVKPKMVSPVQQSAPSAQPSQYQVKSPVVKGAYSQSKSSESTGSSDRYKLQKRGNKKQMDLVMIIAIIAAILALAILVYGAMVSNQMPEFNL